MSITRSRLSRVAATTAVLAVTATGLAATGTATAATGGPRAEHRDGLSLTHFGFQSTAIGTRVTQGAATLRTARLAYSHIACTRMAGRSSGDDAIGDATDQFPAALPLSIGTLSTANHTDRVGRTVSSVASSTLASLTLGPTDSVHVELRGLTTTARSFHNARGFHAATSLDVGELRIVDPSGTLDGVTGPLGDLLDQLQQQAIAPALQILRDNGVIDIPGFGSIGLAKPREHAGAHHAVASINALVLKLEPDGDAPGATVRIGHAWSRLADGVRSGGFQGGGRGAQLSLVDGQVLLGRINSKTIPCEGTRGHVRHSSVTNAGPILDNPLVTLGTMTSKVSGKQLAHGAATGFAKSNLVSVDIANGALHLEGVTAKSNVTQKRSGRILANARGTSILTILVNGEPKTPNKQGLVRFDGGVLQTRVLEHLKRGLSVTAAKVTLGQDGGPVFRFGLATMRIRRN